MATPDPNKLHDQILQEVKRIVVNTLDLIQAGQMHTVVYLFGSWARHEERVSSDIDIGIWYEQQLPFGTFAHIRTLLEESTIPYRVDLVDLTKADKLFSDKVKREGVVWKDYRRE